jgi:hypothetical protein
MLFISGCLVVLVITCYLGIHTATMKSQQLEPIDRAISWLPPDTETVIAARGLFAIPAVISQRKPVTDPATNNYVDLMFQSLPIALLDIQDGLLLSHLKGLPVAAAIEGSRHARPPKGLGEQPFEGAAVVIFDASADYNPVALLQALESRSIRSEEIEGNQVLVFSKNSRRTSGRSSSPFPKKVF